jgi:Subunit CCDC53 of WASH complex
MDIQRQIAAAAVAKANQRNGVSSSQSTAQSMAPKVKKRPSIVNVDATTKNAAKNAAAAAIAAKLGNKVGPPSGPSSTALPSQHSNTNSSNGRHVSNNSGGKKRIAPASKNRTSGGASGPLSAADEQIASQYRKMMKIGMPEGAVRHKMTGDGIPNHIQEAVVRGDETGQTTLHGKSSSSLSSSKDGSRSCGGGREILSPEETQMAEQYRKMMKIGMPEGAVRHKMTSDGVPTRVQEAVLAGDGGGGGGDGSSAKKNSSGGSKPSSLSPDEEKIAAQYRKMMKIGMPEGAVLHKMNLDKVPPNIQKSVLAGESSSDDARPAQRPSSSSSSSSTPVAGCKVSSLSPKEEKIATQYRKMIKMRMPEGAVAHKMNMDGVPEHIQKSVLTCEIPAPAPAHDDDDDEVIEVSRSNALPANPMAAMIASSGGLASLKKLSPSEKQSRPPASSSSGRPSNPLAAAIAASGGKSSLKKASNRGPEKPKSESTLSTSSGNPLLAELSAGGFQSSLRKGRRGNPKYRPPEEPTKPSSTSSLAHSIAAMGGQNTLRKTPKERQPPSATSSSGSLDSDLGLIIEQRKTRSNVKNDETASGKPKTSLTATSTSRAPQLPKASIAAASSQQRKVKVISKNSPRVSTQPATIASDVAPNKTSTKSAEIIRESESTELPQRKGEIISKSSVSASNSHTSTSAAVPTETASSGSSVVASANKSIVQGTPLPPPVSMQYDSPLNAHEKIAENTVPIQPVSPAPMVMEYSPPTPQHKSAGAEEETGPNLAAAANCTTMPVPAKAAPPPLSELAAAKPEPVPYIEQKPKLPAETKTVEKKTVLENGHVQVSKATVTTDGNKSSRSSKRERKKVPTGGSTKKKKAPVDDGVENHCACAIM